VTDVFVSRNKNGRLGALRAAAAAAAVVGVVSVPAHAGDVNWNVASGTWSNPANWDPNIVPTSAENAVVAFNPNAATFGSARVASNVGSPTNVIVAKGNTVTVITRGVLGSQTDVNVGVGAFGPLGTTPSTLNVASNSPTILNPATLNVTRDLRLGVSDGAGVVNHSADFVNVGHDLLLGFSDDPTAGSTPSGTYNQSGGQLTVSGTLNVGFATGSSGHFNLSNFGVANVNKIASNNGGLINQTGGEMHVGLSGITFPTSPKLFRYTLSNGTATTAFTAVNDGGEMTYSGGFFSAGQLTIIGGKMSMSGGQSTILQALNVTVTSSASHTGFLDVNDCHVFLGGDPPLAGIRAQIATGYRDGLWNSGGVSRGITSSAAAASATSAQKTALGYGDVLDLGPVAGASPGAGGPEGGSTVIIRHTFYGDANLDHVVDLLDFNRLSANFGSTNTVWSHGDFNYDGHVDLLDFNLFAANFGIAASRGSVTPQDWSALAAAVPEPGASGVFCLSVGLVASRRRARIRR
jgi:hypothetical protein